MIISSVLHPLLSVTVMEYIPAEISKRTNPKSESVISSVFIPSDQTYVYIPVPPDGIICINPSSLP